MSEVNGPKISVNPVNYSNVQKQNPEIIYLFKSGIFFIALDNDAYSLSNIFLIVSM